MRHSGAVALGKSTLLNMIGGLDSLDAGEISVDGQDVTRLNKKELTTYRKESIGLVFQFYNLIADLTVEENEKTNMVESLKDNMK